MSFLLKNETLVSNSVIALYIIRGSNATIQSVSLDKDYYKKRQTSLVSFVYFPSVDVYYKGRYPVTSPTHIFSKVQIQNGKGRSCAKVQTKDLAGQISSKVEVPISITSNCFDPKIIVTLTDEKGATLDQKEFNIKTTSEAEAKSNTIYIIILVLSILALMYFYMKRKNNTPTISTPTTSNEKIESNTLMSIKN